jgi:AcrR family transcriptional regulator
MQVLGEAGIGRLTQPRVAQAAGVSQSHLTYYYPTRAALLFAVAEHSLHHAASDLERAVAGPAADRSTRLIQAIAAELADKRRIRMILGIVAASEEDRAIKRALDKFICRVRAAVAGEAAKLGLDIGAPQIAAFHALALGAATLNLARDNASSRREIAASLGVLLAGFGFDSVKEKA